MSSSCVSGVRPYRVGVQSEPDCSSPSYIHTDMWAEDYEALTLRAYYLTSQPTRASTRLQPRVAGGRLSGCGVWGGDHTPAFSSHPVGIAALSLKGSNSSTCGGNGELDPSYSASNVDETPGSPPFARTGASAGVSIRGIVPEVPPLVLSRARFAFRCGAPTGGNSMRRDARRRSGTVGRGYIHDSDYHFHTAASASFRAAREYRSDYH